MKKLLQSVILFFVLLGFAKSADAQKALIHYWNFDGVTSQIITPATPTIPDILADYSALDKTKARVTYYLLPGTSLTATKRYIDNVAGVDTVNARLTVVPTGATGNQALRLRNPLDSMELRIYAPTTGFSGIVFKYALQSSSTTSGDSVDQFDYSIDSGKTWKNGVANGMKVNGRSSDTVSTEWNMYQGDVNWGLVTVDLSADATVNNNPKFVLRIKFHGNTSLTSGNNRLDNFTFEGTGGGSSGPPASITVRQPGNSILVAGRHQTIAFDTLNNVGATKTIQYSTDGGTTWNPVGTTTSNTFDWVIPSTPTTKGVVQVMDAEGAIGKSLTFVIAVVNLSTNRIIHYWDFNNYSTLYNNPNIPPFATDFSVNPSTPGSLVYTRIPGTSPTYIGYVDPVPGDTGNAQFGVAAGNGLRVRNPVDSIELRFLIPTTGYKNIGFAYVIEESSNVSPLTRNFDYSTDGGTTFQTTGLSMLSESFLDSNNFGHIKVTFTAGSAAENNANLVFRIKMTGSSHVAGGNDRYDNITLTGDPITGGVAENTPSAWNCSLYPNPATNMLTLSTPAEGMKEVSIFDVTGRVVLKTSAMDKNISIGIAQLTSGMYTLHVLDLAGNNQTTVKFVKE